MLLRKDLLITFLLIVVAPFCVFIHFAPLGDFWDFFIACSAVAVCSIGILGWSCIKNKQIVFSSLVGGLFIFFAILCLLTLFQPTTPSDQTILAVYSVIIILTALLALQLAEKNITQYYDYLAFILFVGGVVESIGAIAIQYRLLGIDYWMVPMSDRFIGFIAQSNQLAIYIMVAFLALCYLALRRSFHVSLLIIFSLLFGFVLLGSGSRATLIYLAIVLLITTFCGFKAKDISYLKLIAGLVALIVGACIYRYLPNILQMFFTTSEVAIDTSVAYSRSASSESLRLSEITKSLVMLKESPLYGVGFGQYASHSFWLGVNDLSYTIIGDLTLHSHNLFAQIGAEFGLIGLMALGGLLFYIINRFWKTPKTLQWWFVVGIFSIYFTNSMLEYVMWRMQFVPLLILVLVPLLAPIIKIPCFRGISIVITVVFAGLFVYTASSSLDAYAKSFFYSSESAVLDEKDYNKYMSATYNLLWGRDIQMQEFSALSTHIIDFPYQEKMTNKALAWRPYAPVIASRIQLILLSGRTAELDKLSYALTRAYPSMVPTICNYFKDFNTIPNQQGLRIVKKGLNCRVLSRSI